MSTFGDEVQHRSTLPNRDYIGRELHRFALESHEVARRVFSLDLQGRHLMSDVFEGYKDIFNTLELQRARHTGNVSASHVEVQRIMEFRTQFLDDVDKRLQELQDNAQTTLDATNSALAIVANVASEISKARAHIAQDWDKYRTAVSVWISMIPWTTASVIEKEHLLANMRIAEDSESAVNQARSQLAELLFDLDAYRQSVQLAREGNTIKKFLGTGKDELMLLIELRNKVVEGQKAIDSSASLLSNGSGI